MTLAHRLQGLSIERLLGIRRGIEKESLRARPDGTLALTPHPAALGSPLTHPHITTDYSESQLELITGVHGSVESCLDELTRIHQFVYRTLAQAGDERLWVGSMPCGLPTDETIPLGRYGSSNIGRAKSVYRMGLGHRYGRRMQTISGIHYNWSMPGLGNEEHFALIRNFRRHAFLLLTLFGASPAVCPSFVAGRDHGLQRLSEHTLYHPYATSLRMGRLGYQSEAQAQLAVSYNSMESYADSLHDALTRPYPAYEQIGIRNLGGEYNQLATTLLQIENEFYGTIRPKRVIRTGERPLHALRERGVEYIEVRCMDLDPFEPVGINARTIRFLDVFLLHCLLHDSPPDTPQEIAELGRNQHHTAAHGREPGLKLERQGRSVLLADWAHELLEDCVPIAAALDRAHGSRDYTAAVTAAQAALAAPSTLPSARALATIEADFEMRYTAFIRAQSAQTHMHMLALPWAREQQSNFEAMSRVSVLRQRALEVEDTMDFETFRRWYVAEEHLHV
ncbi:MAG: glutamate--cysteine ligase [Betaproteobacteria bacterium]|nr:glutamate--cysteine ligase [Betaproteobacteria bacterium]